MENATWSTELGRTGETLERLLEVGPDEDDPSGWLEEIKSTLRDLSRALAGFESAVDDGYFEDVVRDAPRLVPAIKRLCETQGELHSTVDAEIQRIHDEDAADALIDLRRTVSDVVVRLDLCSHRRLDVVHDAYDVDIGGPGA